LIKSDSEVISNVAKDSISIKCCSSELSIHQRILKENMYHRFYKKLSTLIIIITVSWSSDPHIRVISEGSCDTEDCRVMMNIQLW